MHIKHFPDSSNLEYAIYLYNEKEKLLFVKFRPKGKSAAKMYVYQGVPFELWHEFTTVKSGGNFFATKIRDQFTTIRIL